MVGRILRVGKCYYVDRLLRMGWSLGKCKVWGLELKDNNRGFQGGYHNRGFQGDITIEASKVDITIEASNGDITIEASKGISQ